MHGMSEANIAILYSEATIYCYIGGLVVQYIVAMRNEVFFATQKKGVETSWNSLLAIMP